MAFDPNNTPIDYFRLNDVPSPGIGSIEGASLTYKWDERQGYGLSGAFSVFLGRKLAHFNGVIKLYTSEDWADWAAFKQLLERPPAGRLPKVLKIDHPWTAMLGIVSVGVESLSQPEPIDNGGWQITIGFLEWRRPKFSLSKPVAAETATSDDPWDKVIERMSAQADALAPEPTR